MEGIFRNKGITIFVIAACVVSLYHILTTNVEEPINELALNKILDILERNPPQQRELVMDTPSTTSSDWDTNVVVNHAFRLDSKKIDKVMEPTMGSSVRPDDPSLIKNIRKYFLDPPSPYINKLSYPLYETPDATAVDNILNKKTKGFFVECGANDGERSSNTIFLEMKRGWTGLLIEMDSAFYLQMLGKNRKAHSINACISTVNYPSKMKFLEDKGGKGQLVSDDKTGAKIRTAYCFPFFSMMLAMNVTHIDYFSLDVEGAEMEILKTIPFDKIDISILSVEWVHGGGEKPYIDFMKTQGYKKHSSVSKADEKIQLYIDDIIFIKENLV